jgi:hypothetical protein
MLFNCDICGKKIKIEINESEAQEIAQNGYLSLCNECVPPKTDEAPPA